MLNYNIVYSIYLLNYNIIIYPIYLLNYNKINNLHK